MAQKQNVQADTVEQMLCPVRYTLDVVGGKWKLPILCVLATGEPTRYSTLKRRLGGITNMMLSQSLKELEAAGMVHREQYNEVPPRVEYTLSEKGVSILPTIVQLGEWGAGALQRDTGGTPFCGSCQKIR